MPVIERPDELVSGMTGIHLYHFRLSNCSMRVRLLLEEKGVEWTSHHLDLSRDENLNESYFRIHPKGLVPALVHNGVLVIESNDILLYLEEQFPEPALLPQEGPRRDELLAWLKIADDMHVDTMKTYMYGVRGNSIKPEDLDDYLRLQHDQELMDFHRQAVAGIPQAKTERAAAELHRLFQCLEDRLKDHDWLTGDQYTLADICWIAQYVRLTTVGFPFDGYPNVLEWVNRVSARPAYQRGIADWLVQGALGGGP